MHDATKVLMGSTQSSDRDISNEDSDPASFPAGLAVRRTSTGALSLAVGDGSRIGVSLCRSLSDTKRTAVVRAGNRVPVQLARYLVKAQLTFVAKRAVAINIAFVAGGTAGSEVVTVTGNDTDGYLISVSMETTVSTTTQMKAALDGAAAALALIETQIASGQGSTAVAAFTSAAVTTLAQPVVGAAVRFSNVTGKAIPTGGSLSGACYETGALTGLQEDATTCDAALIDMGGGL